MSNPSSGVPNPQQPPQYTGQPQYTGPTQQVPQPQQQGQVGLPPAYGGPTQGGYGQPPAPFVQQPPQKPKKPIYKRVWFWVAVVVGLLILSSIINGVSRGGQPATAPTIAVEPTSAVAEPERPTEVAAEPVVEESTAAEEPAAEEPAVEEPAAEAPAAAPALSLAQQNAVRSAENYLDLMGFSRSGLVDQLMFEDYAEADATLAVDSLAVDWNAEAAESAQSYIDLMAFSRQGLIDQLVFDGYTADEAASGATAVGY